MKQSEIILLLDKRGHLIHSRSNPSCKKCLVTCNVESEIVEKCHQLGKHRRGVFVSDLGSAYLCASDRDSLSSSKLFKKQLHFYSEMLGAFNDIKEKVHEAGLKFTRRLVHNLTSLHAHTRVSSVHSLSATLALPKKNRVWQSRG